MGSTTEKDYKGEFCNYDIVNRAINNSLYLAATLCDFDAVSEICLLSQPKRAEESYMDSNSPLHLVCRQPETEKVNLLFILCPNNNIKHLFGLKDRQGQTLLLIALMKNRVEVVNMLLEDCPKFDYMINPGGETYLHTMVKHNQTPKVLLTDHPKNSKSLNDVHAKNAGGFTALDIPDDKPCCGQIDRRIDKILPQSHALKTRDLTTINRGEPPPRPSVSSTIGLMCKVRSNMACDVLLLMATLLATTTYLAPFSPLGGILKQGYLYRDDQNAVVYLKRSDRSILNLFILLNSLVFFASAGMVIFLLQGFPLRTWPQISVSTLFASCMLSIMAISPTEALPLLFVAIRFLLFAGAGRLYMALDRGQQFKHSLHGGKGPT